MQRNGVKRRGTKRGVYILMDAASWKASLVLLLVKPQACEAVCVNLGVTLQSVKQSVKSVELDSSS